MQDFEIVFFEKADGTEPAKEFIESLDTKMRAKMLKTVMLLAHNGTDLREPYSKYLGDNIFELRAKVGSDVSRVLYFFFIGRRAVLTNGFIKKSQKTPPTEIELAKRFRTEFIRREENER